MFTLVFVYKFLYNKQLENMVVVIIKDKSTEEIHQLLFFSSCIFLWYSVKKFTEFWGEIVSNLNHTWEIYWFKHFAIVWILRSNT